MSPTEALLLWIVGKSCPSCSFCTRICRWRQDRLLGPSSVTGPANLPPAMPNSSGFSVSTRSFIWMRADRFCSGNCSGRRMVPALTRTSASTLSQRAGSNGCSAARRLPSALRADDDAEVGEVDDLGLQLALHEGALAAGVDLHVPAMSLVPTLPVNFS
jgi:hypothetical protein